MSKDLHFEMRQEELAHFINEAEEGNIRALKVYAEVKKLEQLYTSAVKQIEAQALEEATEYPDKTFSEDGFIFERRNGAQRYSYKNIQEWVNKTAEVKRIEERAKQAFIAKQKNILVATDDGEEAELPEVFYSKDSLIVKK